MKIAIDARAFYWTGIGRYIRNIVSEYKKNSHGHTFVLLVPEGKEEAIRAELERGENVTFQYIGVEASYYSVQEQTRFLMQLNKLDVDLVHFTHFNVPFFYRRPYVVTIHDITRFIFPGQKRQSFLQQVAYEIIFANAVKHAKYVISVSNTTKQDMQQLPFSSVAPMKTIYEGVDDEFLQPVSAKSRQQVRVLLGTTRPYFLFVGVWMNHKNLIRLLSAFKIVQSQVPEITLVITGKSIPGYSNLHEYVQTHAMQADVIFPGFVPHELLPALYTESTAFVFPSLYEGFGLPPIEAMACGAPVIASNSSSIPELLQNAAEYVNPESVEDIARAMLKIAQHSEYARRLQDSGKKQSQKYTWETAAKELIAVYQHALEQ